MRVICWFGIALLVLLTSPVVSSAQWVHTGGPAVSAIKQIVADGNRLYAIDDSAGYASTDGGARWQRIRSGDIQIDSFSTIPILTGIGAFGNLVLIGTRQLGLLRSTDFGASWTLGTASTRGMDPNYFAAIGGDLFAGSLEGGIDMSSDEGMSWRDIAQGLPADCHIYGMCIDGSKLLVVLTQDFAPGQSEVFETTNSGQTWVADTIGMANYRREYPLMLCISKQGSTLYVGANDGTVYQSQNHGASWTTLQNRAFGSVYSLSVIHGNIVVGTPLGLYRTSDMGGTWYQPSWGLPSTRGVRSMATDGTNFLLEVDTCGMYRSTDNGGTWIAADIGITCRSNVRSVVEAGGVGYAGVDDFGLFRSYDEGTTWTPTDNRMESRYGMYLATRGATVYVGDDQGLFQLHANGVDGDYIGDSALANQRVAGVFVTGSDLFMWNGSGTSQHRSTDNGKSWVALKTQGTISFSSMAYDGTTFFAGGTNIERSTVDSMNWEVVAADTSPHIRPYRVTSMEATLDKGSGSTLYAGTVSEGVIFSTDKGDSWDTLNSGLPGSSPIRGTVSTIKLIGTNLFAAVDSGIYVLPLGGSTWRFVGQGISPSARFHSLTQCGSELLAGSDSGVWQRPMAEILASGAVAGHQPERFVCQSYPNPLSQSTTISFVAEAGPATVSIVNLLGVEVARLFDGELASGDHCFTWQPSGLPDGVYECVVRMNSKVEKLTLIVLR